MSQQSQKDLNIAPFSMAQKFYQFYHPILNNSFISLQKKIFSMRYILAAIICISIITSTYSAINSTYSHPSTTLQSAPKTHEGGLSSVDSNIIQTYYSMLLQNGQLPWARSVRQLEKAIYSDPVLRYNWEYGIRQTKNLANKTGKEVLDMINTVVNTPPAFDTSPLVGFPINVIFNELMQNQNGRLIFSNEKINNALRDVFQDYAKMLDSEKSLKFMNQQESQGWFSPTASKAINYTQYDIPEGGFKNWNQWFLRKFKPGQRPVGADTPQGLNPKDVIVNACESAPLSYPYQPIKGVKISDQFWLKDDQYSLEDMLGQLGKGKGYSKMFVGGTVYQAFLSALSYHRWHAPIDGTIVDVYKIPGTYYYDRSQFLTIFDESSPDLSQSFLSSTAARMVILIKAQNPKISYLAIIFIGMAEVSGCVSEVNIGNKVKKGDPLGYFIVGGSTHAMLFQKQAKLSFTPSLYETKDGAKKGIQQKVLSYLAHVS